MTIISPTAETSAVTQQAAEVLDGRGQGRWWARLMPFLGPAFIASVAYMDPGNFATNIAAGAKYGYMLLWVVVASNLMAMLIQMLSAKLGIATGRNLAELCRDELPRPVVWAMWGIGEVVAMATDLAEFLGAALGFMLLFHIPLLWGGILTAIVTVIILRLEQRGFRRMEFVITGFVAVIAICYVIELFIIRPNFGVIASAAVMPRFDGPESVVLAAGILGATVMPHVIFLHSALTQRRIVPTDDNQRRKLMRFQVADVTIAMGLAGFVNASMMILAAVAFYQFGLHDVGTIEQAHQTLTPLLGEASSAFFGIALLASGLSSTTVGTMAGQVIMQGFMSKTVPIWVRRGVTMAPALIVIALGVNATYALVMSQVVLSFGIPFALVPLIMFTRRRDLMGNLTNHKLTTVAASLIAAVIIALNVYLLVMLVVA
jgi:manganese transport protein